MKKTIMLAACEPSGDSLGADLILALRDSLGNDVDFIGIGGPRMAAHGFSSLFPIDELNIMGFVEVLPKIPIVLTRLSEIEALVRVANPDILVTIDSPGFNMRLAGRVSGLGFPIIQYVAPQVWAWWTNRVFRVCDLFDEVLCLLPFEPEFFSRAGLPASFVGHSIVNSPLQSGAADRFREKYLIAPETLILLVLPGSRDSEITHLGPIFGEALEDIWRACPNLRVVVPTLKNKAHMIREVSRSWPTRPILLTEDLEKADAFAAARAAMAASGTVALELAIAGVPMVTAYRVNKWSAHIAKHLLRIPYVNLINLLLNKPMVPEIIQDGLKSEVLAERTLVLLKDDTEYLAQRAALVDAMKMLGEGQWVPAQRAAKEISKYLILG